MSMYKRLVRRLSPVFAVDEGVTQVINISCSSPSYIEVSNDTLYISNASNQVSFSLTNYTIANLVTAINNNSGITASVLSNGSASADLLLDIQIANATNVNLNADTSTNGIVLRSRAASLNVTESALQTAIAQLNPYSASSIWLDFWGDILGITRYQNEPDQLYAQRMLKLRFGYHVNNYGIEDFFTAMGYIAQAKDSTTPGNGTLEVQIPQNAPYGFVYSLEQINEMLNVVKPFDSIVQVLVSGHLQETITISESLAQSFLSTSWTYADITWGQFTW